MHMLTKYIARQNTSAMGLHDTHLINVSNVFSSASQPEWRKPIQPVTCNMRMLTHANAHPWQQWNVVTVHTKHFINVGYISSGYKEGQNQSSP